MSTRNVEIYPFSKDIFSSSADPFSDLVNKKCNYFAIKNLIEDLTKKRSGTVFFNSHNEISANIFFKIFNKIPDDLKYAYLSIPDSKGNIIIHHIAKRAETELLVEIYNSITDKQRSNLTNYQNDKGETPVHWIVKHGNTETGVKMLRSINNILDRINCFCVRNNNGETPLDAPNNFMNFSGLKNGLEDTCKYER